MPQVVSMLTRKLSLRPAREHLPRSTLQGIARAKRIAAVEQAISKRGKLTHSLVHGVFVGPARSGKDTLLKRLLGEKPSDKSPSTGVAERVIHVKVDNKSTNTLAATVKDANWRRLKVFKDEAFEMMKHLSTSEGESKEENVNPQLPLNADTPDVADVPHVESDVDQDLTANVDPAIGGAVAEVQQISEYKSPKDLLVDALQGRDLKALQQHLDTHWSLYLSNTGGQMEFQELLPLLTSGPSMFFVTFRLDRDLNTRYEIVYESAKSEICRYTSSNTPLGTILQTLASIDACGTYSYTENLPLSIPLTYRVLLIGTHRDMLEKSLPDKKAVDAHIKEIDEAIQNATKCATYYNKIQFSSEDQLIFTVNNFSDKETDFEKIKDAVTLSVNEGTFQTTSPSHWLMYSLALRQLQTRVETYDNCFGIAKSCGISDQKEFDAVLHFIQSRMGLVRYFPQKELRGLVITDPQVLFDKVSELIIETFTFQRVGKHVLDEFKKGIFSVNDFERINHQRDPDSLLSAPKLSKILEHLRIAALFREKGCTTLKYFFPCALTHVHECSLSQQLCISQPSIPPLVVSFKCGYCPMGIGGALIKYLIANEMQCEYEWELCTDEIFRDQVAFFITGTCDTVILKILPTHLEVSVPSSQDVDSSAETCNLAFKVLKIGIESVIEDINYVNIEPFFTFYCQASICAGNEPHPATLHIPKKGHPRLSCTKNRTRISSLPEGHDAWGVVQHLMSSSLCRVPEPSVHQQGEDDFFFLLLYHIFFRLDIVFTLDPGRSQYITSVDLQLSNLPSGEHIVIIIAT